MAVVSVAFLTSLSPTMKTWGLAMLKLQSQTIGNSPEETPTGHPHPPRREHLPIEKTFHRDVSQAQAVCKEHRVALIGPALVLQPIRH